MWSYRSLVACASGRSRPTLLASSSDYFKGAIHISFRRAKDLELIWKIEDMKPKGDPPTYADYREEWCKDNEVRAALINSIAALSELLRGFNEIHLQELYQANTA